MTDTGPPTDVTDIDVNGQTARGASPFANLQWPTKGLGGIDNEGYNPEDPTSPGGSTTSDEQIACADPEKSKRWNADAKAIEAIQRMIATAFQRYAEDLQNREFGALICEFPDGRIDLSVISDGGAILDADGNAIFYPLGRPSVAIPPTACVGGTPVGFIHTHPGFNAGIPSLGDFDFGDYLVENNGANEDTFGVYTVASYQNPNGGFAYRASRAGLGERTASQQQGFEPAWVNPEATPCPGA